jgi:hypothetical protein
LGTIGLDNEVERQAVGRPRLGRPDDGHQCSSGTEIREAAPCIGAAPAAMMTAMAEEADRIPPCCT